MCALVTMTPVGCRAYRDIPQTIGNNTAQIDALMIEVDAGAPAMSTSIAFAHQAATAPMTLRSPEDFDNATYRDLSLEQAVQLAVDSADVLRDLGATVLRSPGQVTTTEALGLVQTDPQSSIEAALSAYDAQFYAFGKWQNNDRRFNNRFFGGGSTAFKQDTHDYVAQLSKRTATGAQFAVRSVTDYDANNATGNLFPSAWQTQLHAEARQPLLQGGGLTFNRIAGPGAQPGVYNGILIAKVNSDITASKFRSQTRDFVSDVMNAYWDLYFAYRDLDAKRDALERARQTWESFQAQKTSNRKSGASEALAREQYYRFKAELQDAIAGKLAQRTQVDNSSSGGTFAGQGGVQACERKLRLLIGLPISDGTLIRPSDEPNDAPIVFDWDSISAEAIQLRSELQQQRLTVKRREMELLAAKNFLMPSLDLVSIYRLRGLDKHLAGNDSAFAEVGSLDYQEYEASVELRLPVGFRQGHAAVRHARFQVSREKAILHEQERQVLHDLTAVVADVDRAFAQVQTSLNRFLAASEALDVLEANRKAGLPVNLEQLLDAQRRISESQSRYYLSLVEYTIANKNIQFEKGTLLETANLMIADLP
ncbi:Outer membrane efflux protein [Rubripirellula tenax]|uniref:Outer membrane efflux protein n=2 Tax=Rubripirellula tenax TaxID=2528015 RepID=A0A5C6EZN2_9BACT|nr:Outer membrane efflux protein [Rubripirellula tenax]